VIRDFKHLKFDKRLGSSKKGTIWFRNLWKSSEICVCVNLDEEQRIAKCVIFEKGNSKNTEATYDIALMYLENE
jgi:hypothetical protein